MKCLKHTQKKTKKNSLVSPLLLLFLLIVLLPATVVLVLRGKSRKVCLVVFSCFCCGFNFVTSKLNRKVKKKEEDKIINREKEVVNNKKKPSIFLISFRIAFFSNTGHARASSSVIHLSIFIHLQKNCLGGKNKKRLSPSPLFTEDDHAQTKKRTTETFNWFSFCYFGFFLFFVFFWL